jgi:hypothetical protein
MVQLWIYSYLDFVRKNIESVSPYTDTSAPMKLHGIWIGIATIINAVWLTNE